MLLLASCGGAGGGGREVVGSVCEEGTGTGYPHASEPIGTVRQIYDGALSHELAVTTYRNIDRLFPTRPIVPGGSAYALPRAAQQLSQVNFSVGHAAYTLSDFLSRNRVSGRGQVDHEHSHRRRHQ